MSLCKICGKENCRIHQFSLPRTWKKEITGSSPPEIFVGRWNYPNVYTGILAPEEYGDTSLLASHEKWHKQNLSIAEITSLRNKLVYGRTLNNVKHPSQKTSVTAVMQDIAMTHKSIAMEMKLKKPITNQNKQDPSTPLIARAALVEKATLQENAPVKPKIDNLVSDDEIKSSEAIHELYKAGIPASNIMKLLSAGLLGHKTKRKLVPTRWSITAVDDTISKQKLEKINIYKEISEFLVFTAEYLGNHYEFLLLPGTYAFEVIEISLGNKGVWQDHESQFPRTKYADSVTGAYYANRLALTEYLEKVQRQASCLTFREIRPEYNAPCGVGILRETSRDAFSKKPLAFNTKEQALESIQSRLQQPISNFLARSWLMKNYGKQKRITEFF